MTRLSIFNSPLLLGFDHFERVLDQISKASSDGYPPYNIEQTNDDRLKITLAVAGFARDDLHVSVEDNQLVVRGKQEDDGSHTYLHHGIAARQFQRSFVLAEGIKVGAVSLNNGLLHIDLLRLEMKTQARTIDIQEGSATDMTDTADAVPGNEAPVIDVLRKREVS